MNLPTLSACVSPDAYYSSKSGLKATPRGVPDAKPSEVIRIAVLVLGDGAVAEWGRGEGAEETGPRRLRSKVLARSYAAITPWIPDPSGQRQRDCLISLRRRSLDVKTAPADCMISAVRRPSGSVARSKRASDASERRCGPASGADLTDGIDHRS
jgi:hypothetical protein